MSLMKINVECLDCKGKNLSFVLFGYPSEGMLEAEAGGHFMLGGCMPKEEKWFCKDCNKFVNIKTRWPCAYCTNCN